MKFRVTFFIGSNLNHITTVMELMQYQEYKEWLTQSTDTMLPLTVDSAEGNTFVITHPSNVMFIKEERLYNER